jgi:hypothetical protein
MTGLVNIDRAIYDLFVSYQNVTEQIKNWFTTFTTTPLINMT